MHLLVILRHENEPRRRYGTEANYSASKLSGHTLRSKDIKYTKYQNKNIIFVSITKLVKSYKQSKIIIESYHIDLNCNYTEVINVFIC